MENTVFTDTEKPIFLYCLWCPLAKRIRYIGKSIDPSFRLDRHIGAALRGETQHNAARWIRKLHRLGLRPRVRIVSKTNQSSWQAGERELIRRALEKGWPLTNQSAGGEGVIFLTESDAERAKVARKAGFNDSVRQRMSSGVKSAWADPEKRARIVAAQKNAARNPERRAELAKAAKMRTPEGEARRVAAMMVKISSPEFRKAASERMKNGAAKQMSELAKRKRANQQTS